MIKNSKTITFMVAMAALEATAAGLHYFELLWNPNVFASVTFLVSVLTPSVGIYLRTITTKPLSEK